MIDNCDFKTDSDRQETANAHHSTASDAGSNTLKKKWTRVGVPKFKCLVCGDGAYGNNFGLVTCESCKAFFRRQLNQPRPFKCPTGSKCLVTSGTRKYCPACRLQKCFEVGMRPDIGETRRRCKREREKARRERAYQRAALQMAAKTTCLNGEAEQPEECGLGSGSGSNLGSGPNPGCGPSLNNGILSVSSSQTTERRAADSSSQCSSPQLCSSNLSPPSANFTTLPQVHSGAVCSPQAVVPQREIVRVQTMTGWLNQRLPGELFSRLLSVCNNLLVVIQEPFNENELSVLFANQSYYASALPQTFTELQGLREATIRRFIRFVKALEEFRDNFSFAERVAILKRTLLACYTLHFGINWDEQTGRRYRLTNGCEQTIDQNWVRALKRKSGINEDDTNHDDYAVLHGAIRERFPSNWPVVVAALSVATLFSPEIGSQCTDTLVSTSGSENEESMEFTAPLSDRLSAARQLYLHFVVDYAERFEYAMQPCREITSDEKRVLYAFCEERIAHAYAIGECTAERLSTAIRLDPHSASRIIPLLTELKTC